MASTPSLPEVGSPCTWDEPVIRLVREIGFESALIVGAFLALILFLRRPPWWKEKS